MIKTYILRYLNNNNKIKYYCGITNDIVKRLKEHKEGIRTFNRKKIISYVVIYGNYEKRIKFCGIRNMYKLMKNGKFHRICDEDFRSVAEEI